MIRLLWPALFLLVLSVMFGCSSSNRYMVEQTPEFERVTIHFTGKWSLNAYEDGKSSLLKHPYRKADMTFDVASRKATMDIWVSEVVLQDKLNDWKEKWPDLSVEDYKIILTADWRLSKKGDILYLENQNVNLDIKGSGENFESFYNWERSKFKSSKSAGSGGGLAGMALGGLAKMATGSGDLFPKIREQYNFEFNKQNQSLRLFSMGKSRLSMSKTD